jgi:hypothetical protein
MGACFINEDALRQPEESSPSVPPIAEPVPPPAVADAGSPDPLDAGSAPQVDTWPPADPSCPIDRLEPDDSREQLRGRNSLMHVYKHGPAKHTGLTACLEDEDWIPAFSDCCLSDPSGAVVRWDTSVGPLEVDLVDGDGVALPPSSPNDINERRPGEARLLRVKHRGGGFFIRVRASGTVSVPYSIDVYATVLTN